MKSKLSKICISKKRKNEISLNYYFTEVLLIYECSIPYLNIKLKSNILRHLYYFWQWYSGLLCLITVTVRSCRWYTVISTSDYRNFSINFNYHNRKPIFTVTLLEELFIQSEFKNYNLVPNEKLLKDIDLLTSLVASFVMMVIN